MLLYGARRGSPPPNSSSFRIALLVQTYGAALLIIFASAVVGQAICVAVRRDQRSWAAPAVGFGVLVILAEATIRLPGRGATAVAILAFALVVAGAFLIRRRTSPMRASDLLVGAVPLIATSVPFLASGRVGLPGVSVLNDTSNHLLWAEGLLSAHMHSLYRPPAGYPLGPHSLVAAVGTLTGIRLDLVFTALMISIVPITALVAQGVVADEGVWRRIVLGLLCSLGYLLAAYYGEGAFKETIMAGLLLAFVLHLEQVRAAWARTRPSARWLHLLPALFLSAAAVYTYSYLGLAWFAGTAAIWMLGEILLRPVAAWRQLASRSGAISLMRWTAGACAVMIVVLAPVAGQMISFFNLFGASPATVGAIPAPLANLIGPLSPYEALDVWWSTDFRRTPANSFHAGELGAFALAILVFGLIWSVRRRRLLLPAAVIACALIWWLAQRSGSPYVAAKALVIAVPVVTALGLGALLARREGAFPDRVMSLALAAIFSAAALYSSYQDLRNSPVQAPEGTRELAAFSRTIGRSPVLFLGDDDYAPWQLRPAAVTALSQDTASLAGATTRPNKPWVSGEPLDFDSPANGDLNRFPYVITSNTPYASQTPSNFRLVASRTLYDLWQRTGPTKPRGIIEPPGTPGAILDCHTPAGEKLIRHKGEASVTAAPVVERGIGLLAGQSGTVSLPLPTGRWEISIQYTSSFQVHLSAEGRRWTMPAYLGRPGPFFAVGSVSGSGASSPLPLAVQVPRPSFVTGTGGNLFAGITAVAATRLPNTRHLIPLRRACGRYVDWYRLST